MTPAGRSEDVAFKRTPALDAYLAALGLDGTPARVPELPSPGGKVSEKAFTAEVLAFAHEHGWLACHFRPLMDRRGRWQTAVAGDVGFPDVVAVKGEYIYMLELKIPPNRPTPEQRRWLAALNGAHVFACVVTPNNWRDIQELLAGK